MIEDFLLFLEGLNSSLALSDGKLCLDKFRADVVALRSLKGFKLSKAALTRAETCHRTPRIVAHHVRKT